MKNVSVLSDRLADGNVISTRSSERNCLRLAVSERVPQSKRRFKPPSESIEPRTSLGSNEFRRTNDDDEANLADTRTDILSLISQLCRVSNESCLPPSDSQNCR